MAVLRVHNLAKELNVSSKDIIEKCAAEGVELKNHMATISLGLAESIREWFSSGADVTTVEVAAPVDLDKVRKPRARRSGAATNGEAGTLVQEPPSQDSDDDLIPPPSIEAPLPAAPTETEEPAAPPRPTIAPAAEAPPAAPAPEESVPASTAAPVKMPEREFKPAAKAPEKTPARIEVPPPAKPREPIRPIGPQLVPKPAELKGPRVVRIESPEPLAPVRPRPRPPGPGPAAAPAARGPIGMPPPAAGARGKKRGKDREEEIASRRGVLDRIEKGAEEKLKEWRDQDLIERQERLRSATGQGLAARRAAERRRHSRPSGGGSTTSKREPTQIETPIAMKEFCSTMGIPFSSLFKRLAELTGRPWMINETLDTATVELLVADLGLEVEIAKARTEYEKLADEVEQRERKFLQLRPPVVTILGHVDHGKTSLLDRIRKTNVAGGEAGGITQHIGAYRVDRGDSHVTFLDTPGHAAFTSMRARGADLTDVVVLVVAANDGVMPQTVEAINHAKAAGVEIVVALNKIDLPGIDLNKVYGQLAEQELTPTEWGGNTDVVKTSASTGQGVDELLTHLSALSDLMELKADPTVSAVATVIEAQMRSGQGAVAQILIEEGTLKVGQNYVCGPAAGRVRNLRNDRGLSVRDAAPGTPVEISGLDELPRAGDKLFVVDELTRAKNIALEVQQARRAEALSAVQSPRSTLEDLLRGTQADEIPELAMILKADVQGSLDALRQELGKLPAEKVKLVIKHAGIGAVNEADVDLAHVSHAIIVGFNVVSDERARRRAEEIGVEVRQYRIIYELIDDVQKALTGLLAPLDKEEIRSTVEVRKVFSVSKLGSIAGCYVSDGAIARNHKVRLIRDGRIIVDKADIDSLRRFKDDAREVKAGLECGVKIKGYDDLKPGDQIQSYVIVQVAQAL